MLGLRKFLRIQNPSGPIDLFDMLKYKLETSRKSRKQQRLASRKQHNLVTHLRFWQNIFWSTILGFSCVLSKSGPLKPNLLIFLRSKNLFHIFRIFESLEKP